MEIPPFHSYQIIDIIVARIHVPYSSRDPLEICHHCPGPQTCHSVAGINFSSMTMFLSIRTFLLKSLHTEPQTISCRPFSTSIHKNYFLEQDQLYSFTSKRPCLRVSQSTLSYICDLPEGINCASVSKATCKVVVCPENTI